MRRRDWNVRETSVGVGDFLWEEETVARGRIGGVEVRFCEHSRYAQTGEGRQSYWKLVRFEVFTGDMTTRCNSTSRQMSVRMIVTGSFLTEFACLTRRRADRLGCLCMAHRESTRA